MKRYSVAILFLFLMLTTSLVNSEDKLNSEPSWLQSDKMFSTLPEDEQFYMLKCSEQPDSKYFKMGFVMYSYSKKSSIWRIWAYNRLKQDFSIIESYRTPSDISKFNQVIPELVFQKNYRNKRLIKKGLINDRNMFWVKVRYYDMKQYHLLHSKQLIVTSTQSLQDQRVSLHKSELLSMQMVAYHPKTHVLNQPESIKSTRTTFDHYGYAHLDVFSDNKEKTTKKREKRKILTDAKLSFQPPNRIVYQNSYYYFFEQYGYVKLNAFFNTDDLIHKTYHNLFIVNIIDHLIVYSPVYGKNNRYYFFCDERAFISCLWEKTGQEITPLGDITPSKGHFFSNNKSEFNFKPYPKSTKQYDSTERMALDWLNVIKHFNNSKNKEQEDLLFNLCGKNLRCKASVETLSDLYQKDLILPKTKAIPTLQFPIELTNNQWMIKKYQKKYFIVSKFTKNKRFKVSPPIAEYKKETITANDHNLKKTYYKIPIYPTSNYYYVQQPEVQLNKWMIFDDFVEVKGRYSILLRKFKHSHRLKKDILKNNPFKRFDLVQGLSVKKLRPDYKFYHSSHPRVSELEVLEKLEDHEEINQSDQWELHLFLGETTRGFHYEIITDKIAKRLADLNVKSVVVWEFCDYQQHEQTPNDKLFSRISKQQGFRYTYHQIYKVNQFNQIMRQK